MVSLVHLANKKMVAFNGFELTVYRTIERTLSRRWAKCTKTEIVQISKNFTLVEKLPNLKIIK